MYWTLSNLGKNLTDTVVTRAGATLVTTGPYRLVRLSFLHCCPAWFRVHRQMKCATEKWRALGGVEPARGVKPL